MLSKHGPFNGFIIHQDAQPWSDQHKENMEAMAQDVIDCIYHAKFGGTYILAEEFKDINMCSMMKSSILSLLSLKNARRTSWKRTDPALVKFCVHLPMCGMLINILRAHT